MGSTNIYFAASAEEFSRIAPGWIVPSPNVELPREKVGPNPFLNTEVRTWDYRNPVQPEQPPTSEYPELSGFKQLQSRTLDPFSLGHLVNAIDGSDADKVAGQIFGQELVSSGEHEIHIMRVPNAIAATVAGLDKSKLESLAERWTEPPQKVLRKGVLSKLLGRYSGKVVIPDPVPVDVKSRTLREFHALARLALNEGLWVFLVMTP